MNRQQSYFRFWTELAAKAVERPELRSIHMKMQSSKSKNDQYLEAREDNTLYRYNIWWQKDTRACTYICDIADRKSENWVDHGLGKFQDVNVNDWPTIQDQMIDAMIKMARERGLT